MDATGAAEEGALTRPDGTLSCGAATALPLTFTDDGSGATPLTRA
jgi:hypothetical protein